MLGAQSIAPKAKRRRLPGAESPTLDISRLGDEDRDVNGVPDGKALLGRKNVDDLLPIGVSACHSSRMDCLAPYIVAAVACSTSSEAAIQGGCAQGVGACR
jgi:antiviral helicase SKI2